MDRLFWLSYALLWLSVLGLGLLVFMLLRELGRIYLGRSSSFVGDGPAIGERVPDLSVETGERSVSLSELIAGSDYTTLLITLLDCSLCTGAADAVERSTRNSEELGGVILVDGGDLGHFAEYGERGGCQVARLAEGDSHAELRIRATPFALLVDADLTVLAKGILNDDRDLAALVEQAAPGARRELRADMGVQQHESEGSREEPAEGLAQAVRHVDGRHGARERAETRS